MKYRLRLALAIVTGLLACPAFARAQAVARAPAGGSLGGVSKNPSDRQSLDVSVSLAEGYDQDVSERTGGVPLPIFQTSGGYTTLMPDVEYKARIGKVQLGINGGSAIRYYSDLHETIVTNHAIGLGLDIALTPQTSLFLNQSVTYSPALFYGLLTSSGGPGVIGAVIPSAPSDYVLNSKSAYVYSTTASLTRKISDRASVMFSGDFRYDDFTGHDVDYPDLRTRDARGQFLYGLSRNVKLRFGYTFKEGRYLGAPQTTEHDLDVGIDYSRPLSKTRKTNLTFSLGPAIANGTLSSAVTQDLRRQYRLIGDVALTHQLGRTWSLQGTYRRALGYYVEGAQSRVFTQAFSATAGGFLNRRTDLSFTAAYSNGQPELTNTASDFTTYTGDVRVQFGLSRMWATYVEYLFYYYNFDGGFKLPAGVPPYLTRHGLRTGLTLRLPVRHR